MDFKKKMIVDYSMRLNEILGCYKDEYNEIIKKTIQNNDDTHISPSIILENDLVNVEDNLNSELENIQNYNNKEDSKVLSNEIIKNDKLTDNLILNEKELLEKMNETERNQFVQNYTEIQEATMQNLEQKIENVKKVQENIKYTCENEMKQLPLMNTNKDGLSTTSHCMIEDTVLEEQTDLFDNSMNMMNHSVNPISYSFFGGERRKAIRKTGKKIVKRKLDDPETYPSKKRKTDKMENFLVFYLEILKSEIYYKEDNQKILELKRELLIKEDEILRKKKSVERRDNENRKIALKLEEGLKEFQMFRENFINEMKKREEEKLIKNEETALIKKVRLEIQEELLKNSSKLEIEKALLLEERKRFEDSKTAEAKRLEIEKQKVEKIASMELKRIEEQKIQFERHISEQNAKLEKEKELIRNILEKEKEMINQTLCEEREKINQTFLEISRHKNELTMPQKRQELKELNIKMPISYLERKKTIANIKSVNELFQEVKRHYAESMDQKGGSKVQKLDDNGNIQSCSTIKSTSNENPFISKFDKKVNGNIPGFDINRINPHLLYKKSIDFQSIASDPKKYVPKTQVPFYLTDDEFELEEKRFPPALFTKDPKLNYIVKNQNHEEIRMLLGNKKEMDVEKIFNEIENVSNFSPNKLKKK